MDRSLQNGPRAEQAHCCLSGASFFFEHLARFLVDKRSVTVGAPQTCGVCGETARTLIGTKCAALVGLSQNYPTASGKVGRMGGMVSNELAVVSPGGSKLFTRAVIEVLRDAPVEIMNPGAVTLEERIFELCRNPPAPPFLVVAFGKQTGRLLRTFRVSHSTDFIEVGGAVRMTVDRKRLVDALDALESTPVPNWERLVRGAWLEERGSVDPTPRSDEERALLDRLPPYGSDAFSLVARVYRRRRQATRRSKAEAKK